MSPPSYSEKEYIRVKNLATKPGLKRKLRCDKWSKPYQIVQIPNPQNVVIKHNNTLKTLNVNNIKKREPNRSPEVIRDHPMTTRYGRTTKPRINIA